MKNYTRQKQTEPDLVYFYNIRPGNGVYSYNPGAHMKLRLSEFNNVCYTTFLTHSQTKVCCKYNTKNLLLINVYTRV